MVGIVNGQSLSFRIYSVNDGLASAGVMCIFQDSHGYLWVGTQGGLSRFDGLKCKNFFARDGLPAIFINHIIEDRNGYLWIATDGGLAQYSENAEHQGKIKSFTTQDGMAHNKVLMLAEANDGNLWLATSAGLSRYDGKQFTNYTISDGLINAMVRAITIDMQGNIWLGTIEGLSCFKDGKFTNFSTKDGLIDNRILSLLCDRQGILWIGTESGLSVLKNGKFYSYTKDQGLASNWVQTIIEDRKGDIWVGTHGGVSVFSGGRFTNYDTRHGLPSDKIFAIFQDRERNMWFGTLRGICQFYYMQFFTFSVRDGLPSSYVWSILQDRNGAYWFATEDGISVFANGHFQNFSSSDGLVDNSVYSLVQDFKGNIWCGTHGGISIYSPITKKFSSYPRIGNLEGNIVPGLLVDREGVVWVGTTSGLRRYINGSFVPLPIWQESVSVNRFMEDHEGNMWFPTKMALLKVSPDRSQIRSYTVKDGLAHQTVFFLFEDSKYNIWIATERGLSRFHDGTFKNYSAKDGLLDDACYFLLEDDYGSLWIGTGRGINRFDGEYFKNYTIWDGLPSLEMIDGSCLKDQQGNLWFGTVDGVTRFHPGQDPINRVPPPIYLAQFRVMETSYPFSNPRDFRYHQNNVRIDYLGISFVSPEAVKYRYRLDGIDREWRETVERSVSYTYLPHGDYHFQVVAINKDGIESPTPENIRFRILPPFWRTWWFQLITVLVILILIVAILLWRIKRTREIVLFEERNKQLVLAQKMELLGILAGGAVHDLKNLLSIIIAYSKIAGENVKEDVREYTTPESKHKSDAIERIKSTALTAVQVVKQILAFTRQNYDTTIAANLPDLMDDILEILKVSAPDEVTISWERPHEEIRLFINPTRFQQVVMNLCLNAIQAMPEGGTLTIRLSQQSAHVIVLEVSDTGEGMSQDVIEKIFDPLFTTKKPDKGTGLGLFVVKQIVSEYKGSIHVQSVPGQGTTFIITFAS